MNGIRHCVAAGLCVLGLLGLCGVTVAQQAPPSAPASMASTPATDASAANPALQHATLFVINDSGPTLMSSNQDIMDNGEPLASLPRQTFTKVDIAQGSHEFRFKPFPKGKRVATLDAQAGQTYYLLVGYSPGRSWGFPFGGDPMTIRLVDAQQATELMQKMKPQ